MDLSSLPKDLPKEFTDYLETHALSDVTGDTRHWGGYIHLDKKPDYDEKIFWINPTRDPSQPIKALSLQFHGIHGVAPHSEEFTALTDMAFLIGTRDLSKLSPQELEVALDEEIITIEARFLKKGDKMRTPGGYLHAYVNPFFDKYVILTEKRISPENQSDDVREANIYRLYDQDGRGARGSYPEEILNKIDKARENGMK